MGCPEQTDVQFCSYPRSSLTDCDVSLLTQFVGHSVVEEGEFLTHVYEKQTSNKRGTSSVRDSRVEEEDFELKTIREELYRIGDSLSYHLIVQSDDGVSYHQPMRL